MYLLVDVQQVLPELWSSLQRICVKEVIVESRTQALLLITIHNAQGGSVLKNFPFFAFFLRFYSLRATSRFQTRKAPSAITWCVSLMELARSGEKDALKVINAWNSTAAKVDRVAGGKFGSVRNLLDLPDAARTEILREVNLLGFESPAARSKETPCHHRHDMCPKAHHIRRTC